MGEKEDSLHIEVDCVEKFSDEYLFEFINDIRVNYPARKCADLLTGIVNIKLGPEIMRRTATDMFLPVSHLTEEKVRKIIHEIKHMNFIVLCKNGFDIAQVTSGGVLLSEIDMYTMQSTKQHGLYFCGEILNADGMCGGYNLHFAWATGLTAGQSAAEDIIYVREYDKNK